jgi:hypothetical protein
MFRRHSAASGFRKTAVGLRPLCGFTPPTFGAGVNATHCPIARPKRHIQPERYVPLCLKLGVK